MPARTIRPIRPHSAALLAALVAAPAAAVAQAPAAAAPSAQRLEVQSLDAPKVFHACYVPNSGTTYRIKEADLKPACTSPNHVGFSWTDGAGAPGGAPLPNAGGDASGALTALTVTGLQGRAVFGAAPADGNVLGWNAALSRWEPKAAPAGGGAFALPYNGSGSNATDLFAVTQQGTGTAGRFVSTGSGVGVSGTSLGHVGVHGIASLATGAGVRAENADAAGSALEIAKGGIRVTGAGKDTPTAAFWTDLGCTAQYIDNPHSNNQPNAIILVTYAELNPTGKLSVWVDYDSGAGKWMLKSDNVADGFCTLQRANVLIIRP